MEIDERGGGDTAEAVADIVSEVGIEVVIWVDDVLTAGAVDVFVECCGGEREGISSSDMKVSSYLR